MLQQGCLKVCLVCALPRAGALVVFWFGACPQWRAVPAGLMQGGFRTQHAPEGSGQEGIRTMENTCRVFVRSRQVEGLGGHFWYEAR